MKSNKKTIFTIIICLIIGILIGLVIQNINTTGDAKKIINNNEVLNNSYLIYNEKTNSYEIYNQKNEIVNSIKLDNNDSNKLTWEEWKRIFDKLMEN